MHLRRCAGPPPWERFGAERPTEPSAGELPYRGALDAWGDPVLLTKWAEARQAAAAAEDELKSADADLRAFYAGRQTRYGSAVMYVPQRFDPSRPPARHMLAQAAIAPSKAAETAARQAVEDDFKERWFAGEFICYGIRGGVPVLVPSSQRHRLDFWYVSGQGRMLHEPDFDEVRFYRVADHPYLRAALTGDGAAHLASPNRPSKQIGRGRPAASYWEGAKAEAMRWLDENGFPIRGDGNQSALERHIASWLGHRGDSPAESTIRGYVEDWIAEFRGGRMQGR